MSCKEILENFNERINEIKEDHKKGIKRRFEEDELLSMCEDLIRIIYTLEKKSKQDNATIKHYLNSQYGKKIKLMSLYGEHKEIYKNVDVTLYVGDDEEPIIYGDIDFLVDKKFIKIIAHKEDKDFITIYSLKYIHHLKIRPAGKIEELFESEVN